MIDPYFFDIEDAIRHLEEIVEELADQLPEDKIDQLIMAIDTLYDEYLTIKEDCQQVLDERSPY